MENIYVLKKRNFFLKKYCGKEIGTNYKVYIFPLGVRNRLYIEPTSFRNHMVHVSYFRDMC